MHMLTFCLLLCSLVSILVFCQWFYFWFNKVWYWKRNLRKIFRKFQTFTKPDNFKDHFTLKRIAPSGLISTPIAPVLMRSSYRNLDACASQRNTITLITAYNQFAKHRYMICQIVRFFWYPSNNTKIQRDTDYVFILVLLLGWQKPGTSFHFIVSLRKTALWPRTFSFASTFRNSNQAQALDKTNTLYLQHQI
jgi:hypothetical protein